MTMSVNPRSNGRLLGQPEGGKKADTQNQKWRAEKTWTYAPLGDLC